MRLSDVRQVNKQWFAPGNKRFFGDKSYRVLKAKSGNCYLVQETDRWSDMFGRPKKYYFVLHLINPETLKLSPAKEGEDNFDSLEDVKEYLKTI